MNFQNNWHRCSRALVCGLAIAVSAVGCTQGAGDSKSEAPIFFSAAASTTDSIEALRNQFTLKTGNQVELNFGGSSTLAQQILNGGEVNLFLSASARWGDEVAGAENLKDRVLRRVDLLSNRLVVVVPKDSPNTVHAVDDLLGSPFEEIALANPDAAVPAGVYAKEALGNLGLWDKLKPKLVYGDNVRTALLYVETGSAQAGFVYATDAAASSQVRVELEIDPSLHKQVRYPLLQIKQDRGNEEAAALFDYLVGPEAAKVFKKYGFTVLAHEEASPSAREGAPRRGVAMK